MTQLRNTLRNFDRWRRRKMASLEPLLYHLIRNNRNSQADLLDNQQVTEVIIVRNNSRIGNVLFLIPFVKQVQKAYPQANITLMLKQPWQGQFFDHMGIKQLVYSHFSAKDFFKFCRAIYQLRKQTFDLCLSPCGSAEDTIVSALLDAKNKVAYSSDLCNDAFTHTFPHQKAFHHAATRNLCLVPQMVADEKLLVPDHNMAFSQDELTQGEQDKQNICNDSQICIAYFRGARGSKLLSEQTWQTILEKFDAASPVPITWVEITSPDVATPLSADVKTYGNANLRLLASFLRNVDAFVCCDTGPLHLADAASVRCIGLYTETQPEEFGLLGEHCTHIENIDSFDAGEVLDKMGAGTVFSPLKQAVG
ncbi:glycosyltransferase family 9 protein [Vibrio sp.]|uniref:glycosyltransferase family 9 protein n=1 Tax=Vibrio sp. TaxID=678 RepID=UPI003D09A977